MIEHKVQIATNQMIDFACRNFHYSKSIPCGKKIAYSIFEEKKFIGVIIYSLGATPELAPSFGMVQGEVVELTRIALSNHKNPVSRYIAITLKMLKKQCKTVQIVVSYADKENQHHIGAIYQATNWIYLGVIHRSDFQILYNGKWIHPRTISAYKKKNPDLLRKLIATLPKRKNSDKYKYIYCFDKELEIKYRKLQKKYPKKNACLVQKQNVTIPSKDDGSNPINTLHN